VAKVLISIPGDLLARVDREAASRGDTRSDFFQDAARRALGWPSKETVAAALERGRAALATEGPFESADLIAADRAGRDATDRRRR
jgi:Arc/MetJ family transcription regulator